ncbi:MAG: hypothetical protein ACP5N6_16215, partial [Anaerolineae bacterium]
VTALCGCGTPLPGKYCASCKGHRTGRCCSPIPRRPDADRQLVLQFRTAVGPTAGEVLRILRGHTDCVYSVTFFPDSQMLVSRAWNGTV